MLARIEEFYDAVPRHGARAEDHGPITLFVREGAGWPFYARPTLHWTGEARAADVARVRERQRELGIPESFEWVAETSPGLRAAVEDAGLAVHEHPLMVLDADAWAALPERRPADSTVRILGPDDPALLTALSVPDLAFAEPGTGIGVAGLEELAEKARARADDGSVERTVERMRDGLATMAAAVENGSAVCSGQYNRVGDVGEIVGVGTLPAARRRGLALSVTATLVTEARAQGMEIVFLSAGDDDVARIYARLGFRRIGTALIAEPAA
ncbi:hypothetical protein Misp02_47810 [Microtetraspora sp. NBRC 16547]|nr:hypothetical protein Misp02_47810 [Microtetraspora sp. NBRC 16547]